MNSLLQVNDVHGNAIDKMSWVDPSKYTKVPGFGYVPNEELHLYKNAQQQAPVQNKRYADALPVPAEDVTDVPVVKSAGDASDTINALMNKYYQAQLQNAVEMQPKANRYNATMMDQALADQATRTADTTALKNRAQNSLARNTAYYAQEAAPRPGLGNAVKDLGWSLFGKAIGSPKINPVTGNYENAAPANWGEGTGNFIKRAMAGLAGLGGHTEILPGGNKWYSLTMNPAVSMAAVDKLDNEKLKERMYNDQFDPYRADQLAQRQAFVPGFGMSAAPKIDMPDFSTGSRSTGSRSTGVSSMLDKIQTMKAMGYSDADIQKATDRYFLGNVEETKLKDERSIYNKDGSMNPSSEFFQLATALSQDTTGDATPYVSRFKEMSSEYSPAAQRMMMDDFNKVYNEFERRNEEAKKTASVGLPSGVVEKHKEQLNTANNLKTFQALIDAKIPYEKARPQLEKIASMVPVLKAIDDYYRNIQQYPDLEPAMQQQALSYIDKNMDPNIGMDESSIQRKLVAQLLGIEQQPVFTPAMAM
jgi:hypothetical protein